MAVSSSTRGRIEPWKAAALMAPAVALVLVAFVFPIATFLLLSFGETGFTLDNYARVFAISLYWKVIVKTVLLSLLVTAAATVLAYPVAFWMSRLSGFRLVLVAGLVLVPLWTSVLVRTYAWIIILQRQGLVNSLLIGSGAIDSPLTLLYSDGAVFAAMVHVLMPFVVIPVYNALAAIPSELPRAALSLGASEWKVLRNITIPLSLPGVTSGAVIVFVLSLGFFVTPKLIGGPGSLMIATLISQQVTETLDWPFAAALSAILLAVTIVIVLVFRRFLVLDDVNKQIL